MDDGLDALGHILQGLLVQRGRVNCPLLDSADVLQAEERLTETRIDGVGIKERLRSLRRRRGYCRQDVALRLGWRLLGRAAAAVVARVRLLGPTRVLRFRCPAVLR